MELWLAFTHSVCLTAKHIRDIFCHGYWLIPPCASGLFLFRAAAAFLPLKPGRRWKILLFLILGGTTGMVIWVGDNNILFTLPVFYGAFLACSRGNLPGRLGITTILFCLIMSASALLDTYYVRIGSQPYSWDSGYLALSDFFYYSSRLLRPVLAGLFYLALRKRLPDRPPRLSPKLWNLVLILAAMPLSSMLAVVLITQNKYDSPALYALSMNLGLSVLPFVLLTALALLYAVLVLADHERLKQADKLASLRESYYQGLRREEQQIRTIRHDLRNHLMVIQGLLDRGEAAKARQYAGQLSDSPALQGGRRFCENDTANAVLSAKAESLRREGLEADFSAALPKGLPLDDVDLCALLGNALDNAQAAAAQTRDKRVLLRCRVDKGLFMLRVVNAYEGPLLPDFATSKEDKASHGIGLPGMREIAERYGGTLDVCARNGRFELIACLPLGGTLEAPA